MLASLLRRSPRCRASTASRFQPSSNDRRARWRQFAPATIRTIVATTTTDRSVRIQDVRVASPPVGSDRPDLVPGLDEPHIRSLWRALGGYNNDDGAALSNHPWTAVLRWMLQKDLVLRQDFCLLSPSRRLSDGRALLQLYAALTEREIEYVTLSRDTTEADLKQRKEVRVVVGGDIVDQQNQQTTAAQTQTTLYRNQSPVRAALSGRLLVLDGLNKAERNVLPTLNNLLENREMSLDDGSMLVKASTTSLDAQHQQHQYEQEDCAMQVPLHRVVHPDFRVAALSATDDLAGSGGTTTTLDPPLRSRFQARTLPELDPAEVLEAMNSASDRVDPETLAQLVLQATPDHSDEESNSSSSISSSSASRLPLTSHLRAAAFLGRFPDLLGSTHRVLDAYGRGFVDASSLSLQEDTAVSTWFFGTMATAVADREEEEETQAATSSSIESSNFVATATTRALAKLVQAGFEAEGDCPSAVALVGPKGCGKSALASYVAHRSDKDLELFSLYKDMTSRDLLMQRGTDAHGNTIWRPTPLTRAVQDGRMVVLDGIDKLATDALTSLARLLEHRTLDLPDGRRVSAHANFACLALAHPPPEEKSKASGRKTSWIRAEVSSMFYWVKMDAFPSEELQTILEKRFPDLDTSTLARLVRLRDRLDEAVAGGAADTTDEKESLQLTLRKLIHICKRASGRRSDLSQLVRDGLMTSLMPDREAAIVDRCMEDCRIVGGKTKQGDLRRGTTTAMTTQLDERLLERCRRTPANPLLVPNPRFEENPGQAIVLGDILDAHGVGERALLIMGYQGVGKNKVVDKLLSELRCEREYLQLHRDTTAQSLLSAPAIKDGRLVYEDSPLVRAALHGRILVLDEADKCPIEVVSLLKGLIADGELLLPDGRILRDCAESNNATTGVRSSKRSDYTPIHPDFRVWALANPSGYPFHGNDLAKEMADVFSCHTVPPLDPASLERILRSYAGPEVSDDTILRIVDIWQNLVKMHEKGVLAYPFSSREAVSVVRHLAEYPGDGLEGAIENVIAFDRSDPSLMKQLRDIFEKHGVDLPITATTVFASENSSREAGISTPRTRSSGPKHGKEDPSNTPHVGGNTWAGGTGGSDTPGLGGRGGPYRLDLGHKVHQVSDEMKAQVSKEAQARAKAMGEEALRQKLKDLKMGLGDWKRYNNLRKRVEVPIDQLKVHLKDIRRRKEERVWLKRQTTGELDDARIVDALAGEKDVFKRRGLSDDSTTHNQSREEEPIPVTVVADVSASMYRFNGYDGRLERLLEATLMIMEAIGGDERFELRIVGHNGSSAWIPLYEKTNNTTPRKRNDPAEQLRILEEMVAYTQYTWAGDSTLEAIESAIGRSKGSDELVLVISDANLKRYRIEPEQVAALLAARSDDVHSHLILIGSAPEAFELAEAIPNGRAQVCNDSEELPLMMKRILASYTR